MKVPKEDMTLKELKEHCRKNACNYCDYSLGFGEGCPFTRDHPMNWRLCTPRTYTEDFLQKFPNAKLDEEEGTPTGACVKEVYGEQHSPDPSGSHPCREVACFECWKRIMLEEI